MSKEKRLSVRSKQQEEEEEEEEEEEKEEEEENDGNSLDQYMTKATHRNGLLLLLLSIERAREKRVQEMTTKLLFSSFSSFSCTRAHWR